MAWIESHQQLRDHPKILRLSRLLDIHRTSAVGLLHFLWWWALDHAEDGDITDFDALDIATAAGWDGDPDTLVKALQDCGPGDRNGFIARDGERLILHDWWDYAGTLVDRRIKDRERKKKERESSTDGPKDVQGTSEGSPGVQNSTQPNRTEQNKTSNAKAKRATQFPDGWKPNDNHRKIAAEVGADADDQAQRFEDHHVAKGSTFKDWDRAFNNWLRNSASFGTTGKGSRTPKSIEDDWAGAESGRAQL